MRPAALLALFGEVAYGILRQGMGLMLFAAGVYLIWIA